MSDPEIHFVISAPRSGSTWLARALNQHPEIFATEHRFFGGFSETWRNNDGSHSPRITLDAYLAAFAGHYFHDELGLKRGQFLNQMQRSIMANMIRFGATRSGKRCIVDKITPYAGTAHIVREQIDKYFPSASSIELVRDGRDVATSGAFDWLLKDASGTDRYRYFVNREAGFRLSRFFDDEFMSKWAVLWREAINMFESEAADLSVSYESMKQDQAVELRRIYRSLGVEDSPEIAQRSVESVDFKRLTGRRAGQMDATAKARNATVGDWRKYFTRRDAELFEAIAGSELVRCGYEADSNWVSQTPKALELPPLEASP